MPRYMKMIVSVTEADNLMTHLMVVRDLTEMCASLNLRTVIALSVHLHTTFILRLTHGIVM